MGPYTFVAGIPALVRKGLFSAMNFDFDQIIDSRQLPGTKWRTYAEDIIPLWIADMDFRSPPAVRRALRDYVDQGIFGLPHPPVGLDELIVETMFRKHGWEISAEDVVFIPGVTEGLKLACQSVGQPGDQVLMQTPVYTPFFSAPDAANQQAMTMLLSPGEDGRFRVDDDLFEKKITDRTTLFFLCNPHNPGGHVFAQDELERMADICLREDVIICSDEIHADWVYPGYKHVPIAGIDPEIANRTITLIGPSKTYNLADLQFGAAIIQNPVLRDQFKSSLAKLGIYSIPQFSYIGAAAAYQHGDEWQQQLYIYLKNNRDALQHFVTENLPGIQMLPLEASFLAWLDCREAGIEGSPHEFFLENARVACGDGTIYGPGGEGFLRLNFACPRSTMMAALERMKNALASRN
jgi:cysteine-S-conjugate beta-lyase